MKTLPAICLLFIAATLWGQDRPEGRDFPPYPGQEALSLKSSVKLPAKINLAKSKYFPDIIDQYGWSCNQASSIGYLLTYEMNRIRQSDAGLPENRYSPMYVWNFLNNGEISKGVSYFDSWEIIKAGGAPNEVDYPNVDQLKVWMSGYDKYYRAMKNRVIENWSIQVGTPEGLQVLKRYLFDHFDGSKFGGMANFQIASGGMYLSKLPKNSYDEGASYITTFGVYVGHALTVVGYNDSIRIDRNDDGEYTNHIDVNGDHLVDLYDYEKGALIVANSWGRYWGDDGFAYVPYYLLARYGYEGGIWNRSVHIVETAKTVDPILTLRAKFSHSCRNKVRITAGIANDPDAAVPEHILELPMFRYQGNALPFTSPGQPEPNTFEVGLDISPLLEFVETDGPVKLFLVFDERDSWGNEEGIIREVMVYNDFITRDSTLFPETMVPVVTNGRTLVSVVRPVRFNRIRIDEVPKLFAKVGDYVSVQMKVDGAAEPYVWELVPDYRIGFVNREVPEYTGKLLYNGQFGNPVSDIGLPFSFRFYGTEYRKISVTEDALLLFDQQDKDYPYVIDPGLVFQSIKKVCGFGSDLDYYMEGNGISWFSSDTMAAVTWDAMAPSDMGGVAVRIVCELYPDGRIRFLYDQPAALFPEGVVRDLGVSNGDNRMFQKVQTFNPEHVSGVNCMEINPYLYPPGTKFDATGWLFCQPDRPNALYEIRVRVTDRNNRKAYSTIRISTRDLAEAELLSVNYPNPFAGSTRFSIIVPEKAQVVVEIFDLSGRRIKVLAEGEYIPAEYELGWDGRESGGAQAGPGVYLCRLQVGDKSESRKFIKTQ